MNDVTNASEREAAIRELFPLVRRLARRVKRVVPAVEIDDLVGDGCLGAVRAVDSFDAARGTRLETYARRLILGSMLNGLRRIDPLSERTRRRLREADRKRFELAQELGRLPSRQEMERDDARLRDAHAVAYRMATLSTARRWPLQFAGFPRVSASCSDCTITATCRCMRSAVGCTSRRSAHANSTRARWRVCARRSCGERIGRA